MVETLEPVQCRKSESKKKIFTVSIMEDNPNIPHLFCQRGYTIRESFTLDNVNNTSNNNDSNNDGH